MSCDENSTWENQLLFFDYVVMTFVETQVGLRAGL